MRESFSSGMLPGRSCVAWVVAMSAASCGGVAHQRAPAGDEASQAGAGGKVDGTCRDGTCCPEVTERFALSPSSTGWIDRTDACNSVGIQGGWFAFGDRYGAGADDGKCVVIGGHAPEQCAEVDVPPPPPSAGFPNVGGEMSTSGRIEEVTACVAKSYAAVLPTSGCPGQGMAGGFDFRNMSGAGIGLDFNDDARPEQAGSPQPWDAAEHGVIGVEFELADPPSGLRVEFPMFLSNEEAAADFPPIMAAVPTSEDDSVGSPYWGAQAKGDRKFPSSPVVAGKNTVTWDEVSSPALNTYTFDPQRLVGIRFHVPATTGGAEPYAFTVKSLALLLER